MNIRPITFMNLSYRGLVCTTLIGAFLAGCVSDHEADEDNNDASTSDETGTIGGDASESDDGGGFEPTPGGPTPNGLTLPEDFADWRVLGVSNRLPSEDSPSIRVVVGNDLAVDAARDGAPWPDGSMIADVVWTQGSNPDWDVEGAVFHDDFAALALMVKDSERYAADGGWAYGLWSGEELMPPAEFDFDRACVDCHVENVADNDYVFTRPAAMSFLDAASTAEIAPNGLEFPAEIGSWRFLGVTDRSEENGTIRVVLGNDEAVDAARDGEPYPNEAMIADIVWSASDIPEWSNVVVHGDFASVILMEKDAEAYEASGGWAYATWAGEDLSLPDDPNFESGCINCHTAEAAGNDDVFTRPVLLP